MQAVSGSFSELFSVLFYCFLIIIFGYAAGRFNAITSTQSQGIGSFISIFALPALLFKSMVELDFGMVCWTLLLSIFLAKTVLFISVFAIAVFALRRKGIGKGGLYGIFVTQSNDFAIGYPIVHALYSQNYPELLQYIYLAAPISLLVINPFGMLCMEIDRQWRKKNEMAVQREQENSSEAGSSSLCDSCPSADVCCERNAAATTNSSEESEKLYKVLLRALFHLLLNPIIFMVFVGFAFHFIFKGKIPDVLKPLVTSLSNAFSATALFYLGLTMVGKIGKQAGVKLFVPAMLIIAKILVLPVLIRQILLLLSYVLPVVNPHAGVDFAYHNGTWFGNMSYVSILGNYAFLYGTLPTAPTVVIYAAKYGIETDRIASAMVICTTLSAPIMYISAWTLTISYMDFQFYQQQIAIIAQDCSIIGLLASLWCIIVFFLSKKFQRIPHLFTLCLTSSMFFASLMAIINGFAIESDSPTVTKIISFFFLFVGVNSTRLYTSSLAIALVLLKYYGHQLVRRLQWLLVSLPVLAAIISVTAVVATQENSMSSTSSVFVFGLVQDATSFSTILLSLLVCLVSLVLLFRLPNLFEKQERSLPSSRNSQNSQEVEPLIENDDADSSDVSLLSDDENAEKDSTSDYQIGRHISLLILLSVSLLIGAVLTGWRVTKYEQSGVYFELGFFDSVFNFGQPLFVLLIFGFDEELILDPLMQIWYRIRGSSKIPQANLSELDQDILRQCHVFVKHHMENCKRCLLRNKRHGLTVHKDVLTGSDMCTWLVEVGLAADRKEAVQYGQHLLNARLLRHVTSSHNFYDKNFLYQFESRMRPVDALQAERESGARNALPETSSSRRPPSKQQCARRRKCKLGPKQYSFERYLKDADSPSLPARRHLTKLKKQRVNAVKIESNSSSDRSSGSDGRVSDDHPLIDLQFNGQNNVGTLVAENSETSLDMFLPKKTTLKELTDW